MAAITVMAVATVAAAVISSESSKSAARKQERAANKALAARRDEFERTEQQMSPFIRGETPEQKQQRDLVGLNGPEAQAAAQAALETPTTRAIREDSLRGLDQRFSAFGGLGGSNRVRAAIQESQNLDRRFSGQQFNQLGALAGQRMGAAQALAGVGSSSASGQAQILQNIGTVQAQGAIRQGQAFQSGVEGLGSIALSQSNNNKINQTGGIPEKSFIS